MTGCLRCCLPRISSLMSSVQNKQLGGRGDDGDAGGPSAQRLACGGVSSQATPDVVEDHVRFAMPGRYVALTEIAQASPGEVHSARTVLPGCLVS